MVNQNLNLLKNAIARRLRTVREDKYGIAGAQDLAAELRLPAQTWLNYESGVTLPGETLLRFIALTGVNPEWLLTGEGPEYFRAEHANASLCAMDYESEIAVCRA